MKKITEEQLRAILNLLSKYNVGIQEYVAVEKMFKELPANEVQEESNGNTI